MSQDQFEVTFIRGPRDVSPWKRAARELAMATERLQTAETALQARNRYVEKRHEIACEKYPNAIYTLKGRNTK
ncbi:hypothetical protein CIG75_08475 [Tumebacillus algifaecis]|uniref:Uncharacterized protein n=1 Tax=Tumebacillus algifaecis TaxID=1214604 RepID=A0A223D052_9BACL|nr:hypothetical protein [Tumebacillus algifaecis]ASS75018.1 hypothetical protein CIG75_08475 [Tumebacillus algifaecis]